MAVVIDNKCIQDNIYMLRVKYACKSKMGQFFMLRAWDYDPLLSRPISIHDASSDVITFVYQVKGKGTEILSKLKHNDDITIHGPYGNGYPYIEDDICLIGGGIGIAPLYYTLKELRKINPERKISVFLGFAEKSFLVEEFLSLADEVHVKTEGFITDEIDFAKYNTIFTCGPAVMMKTVYKKSRINNAKVYASLEKRMACGVGACLGCTCKTSKGNKKTCKDGPVFLGEEVFDE